MCMSCTKQTTKTRNETRELKKSLRAGFVNVKDGTLLYIAIIDTLLSNNQVS